MPINTGLNINIYNLSTLILLSVHGFSYDSEY